MLHFYGRRIMAVKYKLLAETLKEMVADNIEKGITKLPTEQALCHRFGVSRQTIRQALSLLEEENLIVRRQGSGSFLTGLSGRADQNIIHILATSDNRYLYPALLDDIQKTLSLHGFSAKIHVTGGRFDLERQLLLEFLKRPPRGIIAEPCKSSLPNPNASLWRRLEAAGTNLLCLFSSYDFLRDPFYLKEDNLLGSSLLVQHLAEQGHTAVGGIFCCDSSQGLERFQGFMEACDAYQFLVRDQQVSWFHTSDIQSIAKDPDRAFLRHIIDNSLTGCTAVVCQNDEIAYLLSDTLRHLGYTLPGDMAVVSFDNSYLSNSGPLSITSLAHEPGGIGGRAAQMMADRLKGLPVKSQEVPWKLMVKESSRQRIR